MWLGLAEYGLRQAYFVAGRYARAPGEISEPVRKHLTDVIGSNLRSAHPLPMVLKVGENVDHTHDLHVKTFAHGGHVHIGLHMLWPNTTLK